MIEKKVIYYLDDDSDDLYFFKNAASGLGHQVSLFSDGYEFFDALRQKANKPDIIFLDVHMPVMRGEEILQILKQSEFAYIPIVMISGAYPKKLVKHFLENGANHLMKKVPVKSLRTAIEQVLESCFSSHSITTQAS